jgi:serine/threonine protein phosphatase 1
MGNIFAIGDIHGSADKLIALAEKLAIDFENDTLVFVGDYIDRGPASFEVVEYLLHLKKRCRNVVCLKGNHEDMFLNYIDGPDKLTYMMNGGKDTLESYLRKSSGNQTPIPPEHIAFFRSLLPYYETEDYIFVHAGLRENIPLKMQEPDDLLWIRNEFIDSDYDFGKMVIFGHTPFLEPLMRPNKVGIDTGAVYGNKLTCLKLPDFEFYFE